MVAHARVTWCLSRVHTSQICQTVKMVVSSLGNHTQSAFKAALEAAVCVKLKHELPSTGCCNRWLSTLQCSMGANTLGQHVICQVASTVHAAIAEIYEMERDPFASVPCMFSLVDRVMYQGWTAPVPANLATSAWQQAESI